MNAPGPAPSAEPRGCWDGGDGDASRALKRSGRGLRERPMIGWRSRSSAVVSLFAVDGVRPRGAGDAIAGFAAWRDDGASSSMPPFKSITKLRT